nr:TolC family outer membrane protein [Novosphingobium lentum]
MAVFVPFSAHAGPVDPPLAQTQTPGEPAADIAVEDADPTTPVTTFGDAIQRSYRLQPALLAERAKARSVDYLLPQARAQYGPRIDFQATYGYQRDNIEVAPGTFRSRSGWSSTASAILTQPLYTFGRNAAATRTAAAQISFERAVLRSTEAQVLFDATSAYVSVIRDRAGIAIARDNLSLLERELSDNRARFAVHAATATDVDQVETRVGVARAQLLSAQRAIETSEAEFVHMVGALPGNLSQPNPLRLPTESLEEAYAFADLHNPVIEAANARERNSRAQWDAARADLLPRVDLRGRADFGSATPYSDSLRQTGLRGEVVISGPLFDSGLRRARVAEAKEANDADWRLVDQAGRDTRNDLAASWSEWQTLQASTVSLEHAVASAQSAYDGALVQERAGFRTTLEVLDLARELLSARTSLNAATSGAYIAQARILRVMGVMEQEYLFPDLPANDPETHFDRAKHSGDVPLVTPALRAVDGVFLSSPANRPNRDRSATMHAIAAQASPAPSQKYR